MITNHQQKQSRWLMVLIVIVSIVVLMLVANLAYKKWVVAPIQQANQSELVTKQQFLLAQDDVINTNWLRTLDPLVKNVEGRVLWSNMLQQGVIEFVGLPEIEDNQKYQLWIYDLVGENTKPIFSKEFSEFSSEKLLLPFSSKELIYNPFKFELMLKTEGEDVNQPLFLAQP